MAVLPSKLVEMLPKMKWWEAVRADKDLQLEVRFAGKTPSVTIYYRGAALLRNLKVRDGKLECQTHLKYLPVGEKDENAYVSMVFDSERGFVSTRNAKTIDFGQGDPDLIRRFKRQMYAHSDTVRLEGKLIGAICKNDRNLVIDQEIALRGLDKKTDRPDLAVLNPKTSEVCIVEVKRMADDRLWRYREKMVDQLQRYSKCIERHKSDLVYRFKQVVTAKRELGLDKEQGWPRFDVDQLTVNRTVFLLIGECINKEECKKIRSGEGDWSWLKDKRIASICHVIPFKGSKVIFP